MGIEVATSSPSARAPFQPQPRTLEMRLILLAQEAAVPAMPQPPFSLDNPLGWVDRLDESHLFVLLLMIILTTGFVLVTALTTITSLFRSNRLSRLRADLIRDLLDRGFHASEIRDIVALTGDSADLGELLASAGGTTPPKVSVPPIKKQPHPGPLN